jgi:hypothetical protein
VAFNATLWPLLRYPPFPRTLNVEALTFTAATPSSLNGGTYVPGSYPRLLHVTRHGSPTGNGGTFAPPPAPPSVIPPPASSGRVSFTPAATIAPNLTVVSPVTTQKQINNFFRIVDPRLNNQAT